MGSTMQSPLALPLLLFIAALAIPASAETTTASYDYTKTLDFRSLTQYASSVPATATVQAAAATAPASSDYFASDAWTSMFGVQDWSSAANKSAGVELPAQNSADNVFVESSNNAATDGAATWLTLRTTRQADFQSIAEFDSVNTFMYPLDVRMFARASPNSAPGACLSMFLYYNDSQEVDIEILTRDDPDRIWYTNQPDSVRNASDPGMVDWSAWAEHRIVWDADATEFWFNGTRMARFTQDVPTLELSLIFNAWSKGQATWEGEMEEGGEAGLQVQWIELRHNNAEQK